MRRHVLWTALLVAATVATARADEVHLRDGRVIKGEVEETATGYKVQTRFGEVAVPRADVLKIVRTAAPAAPADATPAEGGEEAAPERRGVDRVGTAREAARQAQACRTAAETLLRATLALDSAFGQSEDRGLDDGKDASRDMRAAARQLDREIEGMQRLARRFDWATRELPDAERPQVVRSFGECCQHLALAAERTVAVRDAAERAVQLVTRLIEQIESQLGGASKENVPKLKSWAQDLARIRLESSRTVRALESSIRTLQDIVGSVAAVMDSLGIEPPSTASGPGGLAPPSTGLSSGTGFFVGPRHIVTNAHVVGAHPVVRVQRADGTEEHATVVRRDDRLDLAVIEVAAPGPGTLSLCLDGLQPGVVAFAYGYGVLGDQNTMLLVTRGTVSARQLDQGLIVFDGRVNPGNSGGPLVDAGGRWMGVVVAKSRSSEAQAVDSLGLAIDGAVVLRWLTEAGLRITPTTGVSTQQVPPDAEIRRAVVRIVAGG